LQVLPVGFEQAAIKVRKAKEFGELKSGLVRIFAPEKVEQLLKGLESKGIRIRDFDLVLTSGLLERLEDGFGGSGGRKLYDVLPTSDQAQLREFYLSKVEEVDPALRAKFQKLYRYY
jgi:hypothetical protein